jgi:hypothetical protein
MTKSKTEAKCKSRIIFEKLTVEEEKEVRGGSPDKNCTGNPPNIYSC